VRALRRTGRVALASLLLAGCGGGSTSDRPRPTVAQQSTAPVLARFQRNGGLAATLDVVTIRTDGAVRIDNRHGARDGASRTSA
jgi:hypothetical protein